MRHVLSCLALVTACGDNLHPDVEVDVNTESDKDPPPTDDKPRELEGFIGFTNPDCDRATLGVEAVISYADDGSAATDLDCYFTFDDGGAASECAALHEFRLAGGAEERAVKLIVRDRASGACLEIEDRALVYREMYLDATVVAPACGLEISYGLAYFAPITGRAVFVDPPEKVLFGVPDEFRFVVSEPGSYSVTVRIEQERPFGPFCTIEETSVVEVAACPDDHPPCGSLAGSSSAHL